MVFIYFIKYRHWEYVWKNFSFVEKHWK
jgi:hypothetical protein